MLGIQQVLRYLKNACRWIDLWERGTWRNYTKDRGMTILRKANKCVLWESEPLPPGGAWKRNSLGVVDRVLSANVNWNMENLKLTWVAWALIDKFEYSWQRERQLRGFLVLPQGGFIVWTVTQEVEGLFSGLSAWRDGCCCLGLLHIPFFPSWSWPETV